VILISLKIKKIGIGSEPFSESTADKN
jgi:hypothetical protein